MLRTILLLLFTLVALPYVVYHYGAQPDPGQWQLIRTSFQAMLGVALLCFVVSELTRNYSQVDKLWSIVPIGYVGYFAYATPGEPRMVVMAVLVGLWGARLTYNFARRGGYTWPLWAGEEDYRWEVLRRNPLFVDSPWAWRLFNLLFISLYQHSLIWLFTLPAVAAAGSGARPWGVLDYAATGLFLVFLVLETLADQQQYNFQTEKYRRMNAGERLGEPYAQGFVSTGLWAWVRHPNYAAEQAIWLSFYLFAVAATGQWLHWSLTGALLLVVLFRGSSNFSEEISAAKYPGYQAYQARTPRFVPSLKLGPHKHR